MEKSKYLRSILSLQEIYRSKIIPDKEEDGELILIKSFLLRSRADAVQLYRPFLFQSGKEVVQGLYKSHLERTRG